MLCVCDKRLAAATSPRGLEFALVSTRHWKHGNERKVLLGRRARACAECIMQNAVIHRIIQLFVGPYAGIPTVKPMVTATVNNHDYETSHGCHTLHWQPRCCQPVKALQISLRTDYRLHTYSSVSPYIVYTFVATIHVAFLCSRTSCFKKHIWQIRKHLLWLAYIYSHPLYPTSCILNVSFWSILPLIKWSYILIFLVQC